jgi:hypothetical protein
MFGLSYQALDKLLVSLSAPLTRRIKDCIYKSIYTSDSAMNLVRENQRENSEVFSIRQATLYTTVYKAQACCKGNLTIRARGSNTCKKHLKRLLWRLPFKVHLLI